MLVMTYSDARKNFASILDKCRDDGAVLVKRMDGSLFRISPEPVLGSPFAAVKPVVKLDSGTSLSALRESRSRE